MCLSFRLKQSDTCEYFGCQSSFILFQSSHLQSCYPCEKNVLTPCTQSALSLLESSCLSVIICVLPFSLHDVISSHTCPPDVTRIKNSFFFAKSPESWLKVLSQPPGDLVLDGNSTLTLTAASLQQLTRLFEQYLLPRSQQHGFLALPSHPADTASLLQLQFLFDVLQKTISLKVSWDC